MECERSHCLRWHNMYTGNIHFVEWGLHYKHSRIAHISKEIHWKSIAAVFVSEGVSSVMSLIKCAIMCTAFTYLYYHIDWIWASNVWAHDEKGCFNYVIFPFKPLSTLNIHPAPSQLRGILIYLIRLVVLMQPYNVVISPLSEDCQVTTHL